MEEEEGFRGAKKIPHEHGKEAEEEEFFLRILRARMLFIQLFDFEKVLPVDRHHLYICICMYICIGIGFFSRRASVDSELPLALYLPSLAL